MMSWQWLRPRPSSLETAVNVRTSGSALAICLVLDGRTTESRPILHTRCVIRKNPPVFTKKPYSHGPLFVSHAFLHQS